MAEVEPKTWVKGEVINAEPLNRLEQNAANAYNLAQTNEHDIGEIYDIVEAVTTQDTEPQLDGSKIAPGSVKATALSLGNGVAANKSTGMLEVPIDADTMSYTADGLSVNLASVGKPGLVAVSEHYPDADRKGQYAAIEDTSGHIFFKRATNSSMGLVVPDGKTLMIDPASSKMYAVLPSALLVKQTATMPTNMVGIRVSHLYAESDGTLHEGVFDITNGNTTGFTIPAETTFATGLALAAKVQTYSCLDFVTGDELTLEVNSTGKSINFTTDVRIEANKTLHVYVRDNNG